VIYLLTEEQSLMVLEGGWDLAAVQEYVALDLAQQGVEACVAVLFSDGVVAFYLENGEVV
jgi:hypothetical protein